MKNQQFHRINLPEAEREWLYAPDMVYTEYGEIKRHLQLIFPYQRSWKTPEKFPLVLFLPGSAWHRQEMYNNIPARAELAKRGFVIAQLQFRESELAVFPAQVEDVMAALRFLPGIAEQFHIDLNNVFLAGDSSGGHIALLAGLTAYTGELDPDHAAEEIPVRIGGIISYSAPTDMMLSEGSGHMEALLGVSDMQEAPELAARASCASYVSCDRPVPPILMFHGDRDDAVKVIHARNFFQCLTEHNKEADYYELSGGGHGGAVYWSAPILDIAEAFLRRCCLLPGNMLH